MKQYKKMAITLAAFLTAIFLMPKESQAVPNFARKYGADCAMCHTAVPRLNRFGYEFRNAAYRDPAEIGKEDKGFDLGNFFSARIQETYDYKRHRDVVTTSDSVNNQLYFKEFTMYPLTGSWGKYFGSLSELSVAPDDNFEIENAFVRGVYPTGKGTWLEGWFQGRIGVMHSWEGFGASDRPLSNFRPLFQKNASTGSPFVLWSPDESGAEIGYYASKTGTTISGNIWNGIRADGEAAKGGTLTKESNSPAKNNKDFQLFINQFLRDDTAVSMYYYHGTVPFPATGTQTTDLYDRLDVYGNFYVVPDKVNLIGGYGWGNDSLKDKTVTGGSSVGHSEGFFGGAEYFAIPEKLAFTARYDAFDPSKIVDHNSIQSVTLSANVFFLHGLQLITDYQHKQTEVSTGGRKSDDEVLADLIFVW